MKKNNSHTNEEFVSRLVNDMSIYLNKKEPSAELLELMERFPKDWKVVLDSILIERQEIASNTTILERTKEH